MSSIFYVSPDSFGETKIQAMSPTYPTSSSYYLYQDDIIESDVVLEFTSNYFLTHIYCYGGGVYLGAEGCEQCNPSLYGTDCPSLSLYNYGAGAFILIGFDAATTSENTYSLVTNQVDGKYTQQRVGFWDSSTSTYVQKMK